MEIGSNRLRRMTGRWGAMSASGGVVGVTLLLLLSPLAAGAGHTYRPPYTTMYSSTSTYQGQQGCGTESMTTAPTWNSSSGVFTIAGKTSSKNCGASLAGVGGSSEGYFDGEVELAMPVKVTASTHNVTITWKVSAAVTSSYSAPKSCTGPSTDLYFYCDVSSDIFIESYPYLIDTTNGTYFYPSTYWDWYNESYNETEFYNFSGTPTWYNYSGSYAYGGPGTAVWYINSTYALNPRDSYVVLIDFYVDVSSDTYAYGYPTGPTLVGGSASASVNMASGANKATLTSIGVA